MGSSDLEVSSGECSEERALSADDESMSLEDMILAMYVKIRKLSIVK